MLCVCDAVCVCDCEGVEDELALIVKVAVWLCDALCVNVDVRVALELELGVPLELLDTVWDFDCEAVCVNDWLLVLDCERVALRLGD